LKDEQSRIDRYLTWDSIKDRLFKTFKEEMLYRHQASLLDRDTGVRYLLQGERTDELALLFYLYQDKEEYLQPIALAFREHVQLRGQELVGRVDFNQEEHKEHTKVKEVLVSTQIIEQLVGMLEKYQTIVKTCFQGHVIFERSRQGAFETFLNKDGET